jgi:hypothetical protein
MKKRRSPRTIRTFLIRVMRMKMRRRVSIANTEAAMSTRAVVMKRMLIWKKNSSYLYGRTMLQVRGL